MLQQLAFAAAWLLAALILLLLLASSLRFLPAVVDRRGRGSPGRCRLSRTARSGNSGHPDPASERSRHPFLSCADAQSPTAGRAACAAREGRAAARPADSSAAQSKSRGIASGHLDRLARSARDHGVEAASPRAPLANAAAPFVPRPPPRRGDARRARRDPPPDVDNDKAQQRLWELVSDARAHLGESIVRENERYLLDREAVAVDLDQFERLLTRARAERDGAREQLLEGALALVAASRWRAPTTLGGQ